MQRKGKLYFLVTVVFLLFLSVTIKFLPENAADKKALSESDKADTVTTSDTNRITFLLIGRDTNSKVSEPSICGAILCSLDTTSNIEFTFLPGDTVVRKGGTYKTLIWGGDITLDTVYRIGYSMGGASDATETINLAIFNNWGISIDSNLEVSSEVFNNIYNQLYSFLSISSI